MDKQTWYLGRAHARVVLDEGEDNARLNITCDNKLGDTIIQTAIYARDANVEFNGVRWQLVMGVIFAFLFVEGRAKWIVLVWTVFNLCFFHVRRAFKLQAFRDALKGFRQE